MSNIQIFNSALYKESAKSGTFQKYQHNPVGSIAKSENFFNFLKFRIIKEKIQFNWNVMIMRNYYFVVNFFGF